MTFDVKFAAANLFGSRHTSKLHCKKRENTGPPTTGVSCHRKKFFLKYNSSNFYHKNMNSIKQLFFYKVLVQKIALCQATPISPSVVHRHIIKRQIQLLTSYPPTYIHKLSGLNNALFSHPTFFEKKNILF